MWIARCGHYSTPSILILYCPPSFPWLLHCCQTFCPIIVGMHMSQCLYQIDPVCPHRSPALFWQFQKVFIFYLWDLLLFSTLNLNNSCLFPNPTVCPMEYKSHGSKDSIIFYHSLSFFSRVPSRWYYLKP